MLEPLFRHEGAVNINYIKQLLTLNPGFCARSSITG